jgi:hypothetical protein
MSHRRPNPRTYQSLDPTNFQSVPNNTRLLATDDPTAHQPSVLYANVEVPPIPGQPPPNVLNIHQDDQHANLDLLWGIFNAAQGGHGMLDGGQPVNWKGISLYQCAFWFDDYLRQVERVFKVPGAHYLPVIDMNHCYPATLR